MHTGSAEWPDIKTQLLAAERLGVVQEWFLLPEGGVAITCHTKRCFWRFDYSNLPILLVFQENVSEAGCDKPLKM